MRPLIGIPACTRAIGLHPQHATPSRYAAALVGGADALPVLIPPVGATQNEILDRLDGVLLSGSPSNIEPHRYGVDQDETPDFHDPYRDDTMLPLIPAAIARGLPVLGICRGLQELNVALGGSLHQRVHELPGRLDHRGGEGPAAHAYRPQHDVMLNGRLAQLLGARITVNSVHGQAIDRLAPRLVVEGLAPDGTIEAVRVDDATSFAFAVQWHPEWDYADHPDRLALFQAFGAACRSCSARARP